MKLRLLDTFNFEPIHSLAYQSPDPHEPNVDFENFSTGISVVCDDDARFAVVNSEGFEINGHSLSRL
jgi:hypothetical protein